AQQRRVPPDRTTRNSQDPDGSSPRFPPPSGPLPRTRTRLASEETRSHRSLLSGQRAERVLRRAPEVADDSWDGEEWNSRDWERHAGSGSADRSGDNRRARDSSGRMRANSAARPLPAAARRERTGMSRAVATIEDGPRAGRALSTASVPDLIAYRPARARPRV